MANNPDIVWTPIAADGQKTLGSKIRGTANVVILVYGGFGGGTLTFGYIGADGAFKAFIGVTALTTAGERSIEVGKGVTVAVSLAGATTPTITVGRVADDWIQG